MTSYDYRKRAWESLKGSFWYCVGVTVLYSIILGISSVLGPLSYVFAIFVGYPLAVGVAKFFINNSVGAQNISDLFAGFKVGYLNSVVVMLIMSVKIFLWSLLLVIPGIIKSFEYAMIPYILAENPNMTYKDAFALSKKMMDGSKFDLFVLNLSFIGWILLSCFTFGIGFIFLTPYMEAANAEFYMNLKTLHEAETPVIEGETVQTEQE